jgi:diaminohydroxyphosphoribosylaminopyrimidine deaminase/5-amino-6-(5-phosphoribosylamino)uracil reductase
VRVVLSSRPAQPELASLAPRATSPGVSWTPAQGRGDGVVWITEPQQIAGLPGDHLLVEGGARTAAAFLIADLVDRLLLYRAPIVIGGGLPAIADLGMTALTEAHGQWHLTDARQLGADRLEVYERPGSSGKVGTVFPPG